MTKVISLQHGEGKTTQLVHRMADNPNMLFVAPTATQAEIGRMVARKEGLSIDRKRFVSAGHLLSLKMEHRLDDKELLIDEASSVLHEFLGAPVAAIALTESD